MQAHGQYDYSYDDYQQSDQYSRQQPTNQQIPATWQSQETAHPSSSQLNEMELELEMMKRKRQMIQEQRQLLQEQQQLDRLQRQYDNSPRQNYNQYQNYGEGYGNRNQGMNQRGVKRQAPNKPWRDQPKRFASNPPPFNKPAYVKPVQKPVFSTPVGRPKPKFAPKPPTNTMERQAAMDVGPVEPPSKRAVPPRAAPPRAASSRQEEIIFRGVETASRSVVGKLELVLGKVLGEMREEFFCPPRSIYLNSGQTRGLKERLRERIHKMMLGKPIQNPQVMHDMYRKLHTLKGDLRLINTILANPALSKPISKQEKPATTVAKTEGKPAEADAKSAKQETEPKPTPDGAGFAKGKAGRYIKANIREKLDKKMDEIFAKLYKICMDDAANIENEPLQPPEGLEIEQQNPEEATEEAKETPAAEAAPADADEPVEVPNEDDDVIEIKDDSQTDAEIKESTEEVKESDEKKEPNQEKKGEKEEIYFGFLMDRVIRRKMPSILPRYKNYMMNIIASDKQFSQLGLKCNENPAPVKRPPLFFAKVLGRPNLPPRQVMQGFLEQFVCTSVKKHRNIYNLLFVGFSSEELLKKFLESDGATVGGKKLDIRPSIRDGKPNGTEDKANKEGENKEEPSKAKLDNAINELDNDIDDLLTSIKGTDNSTDKADEAGGEKAEIAEEKAEPGEENAGPAEEKVETDKDDEAGWGEGEGVWDQEDTAGAQTETPQKQEEKAQEETDDVVEVKEDAKSTPIRTRRSSRLPQKN